MKKKKITDLEVINPLAQQISPARLEEFKAMVKRSMPEFVSAVENKEDLANSMYGASQEMWLCIADVLLRYHNWKESELKQFYSELTDILTGVKEFERHGLSMLSPHSVDIVGEKIESGGLPKLLAEIAEVRYDKEKTERIGFSVPIQAGAKPFLKKLKERNDKI